MSLENKTDSELIHVFLEEKNKKAFDVLLRRHYQRLYLRFIRRINDEAKAHDLCQTLWLRVLQHLPSYQDKAKFEHYLNTIASNLLKDHWRAQSSSPEQQIGNDQDDLDFESSIDLIRDGSEKSEEEGYVQREAVHQLVNEFIPDLPCDQRLVYLLRHESEFWDGQKPLQWQHLAELNGMEAEEVCAIFESVRDRLIKSTHDDTPVVLTCIEKLIFLVWTQSQRVDKKKRYTESYYAELLDMPVNSFKTKYRASVKSLAQRMSHWR